MEVVTTKYVRKPLYVDAVQVTSENFQDVARWCMGDIGVIGADPGAEIKPAEGVELDPIAHYIRIRVHNPQSTRQSKAFVDDWVLYTDRGYKVYTEKAFADNFDPVDTKPGAIEEVEEQTAVAVDSPDIL